VLRRLAHGFPADLPMAGIEKDDTQNFVPCRVVELLRYV